MIEVTGRVKHHNLVEDYVLNLVRYLKIDRRRKWSLEIEFKTRIDDNCLGLCYDDTEKDIVVEIARRVDNRRVNFYEQMQTLAHEMVHVRQFIDNEYPSELEAKNLEYELYARCFPWSELP